MGKKTFKINLTEIEGQGEFGCPKCGIMISPEDETENVYTILNTIIGDDDILESIVMKCNTCRSTISLDGFDTLAEVNSRVKISDFLPESEQGYRSLHTISLDNESSGQILVEYAQKEDVKAFKRLKKLRIGDPYKGTITVKNREIVDPKREELQEITKAVKRKFKGLKNRDLYVVEIKEGRKNLIGRVSNLLSNPIMITQEIQ